jgi:DNA-binding CsgD family transcriptional regulator
LELDPDVVGAPVPRDSEVATEKAILHSEALAWAGRLDDARTVFDEGSVEIEQHPDVYWQGWLAMVGMRIEADAAADATTERTISEIEAAQARANAVLERWTAALREQRATSRLFDAQSHAIAAELARLSGADVVEKMRAAADAFDTLAMPYYATYLRYRQAEAMIGAGARPQATELLKRARNTALTHGFAGLEHAIATLARAQQLRLGPGRTNVDGDDALSVRELEVLRLMVDGRSNPEIAEALFISRRTAAAHVSNILRKFDATSRVEAVSEALRRGYV